VAAADLIVTGEGSLDAQSLTGKGPVAIARLARRHGKPVIAFCGRADEAARASGIFDSVTALADSGLPPVLILLIMGLGMPGVAWPDPVVDGLVAAGFRVIRFDNRDCGHSGKVAGGRVPYLRIAIARALLRRRAIAPYTLDDMAADSVGLLDVLGIERAHLVGASRGGMIAQNIAALYPQRVASLTSIMSSTGFPALIISIALRGRARLSQNSSTLYVPMTFLPRARPSIKSVTLLVVRL
jgi:pimeloyl-ACP methyl ester carboxylesterase